MMRSSMLKNPVGQYLCFAGTGDRWRRQSTGLTCPYCEVEMLEGREGLEVNRIVREVERTDVGIVVETERVPETHRMFACKPCDQGFTVPRDQLAPCQKLPTSS